MVEVSESYHRSHFSVVALRFIRLRKEDEALKFKGASSKSNPSSSTAQPVSKVNQIQARHRETGRTTFHIPVTQARRIQAWHGVSACISQVSPGILESWDQKRQIWMTIIGCLKERKMLTCHLYATSLRNPNVQASGDPLQSKEDDDKTNMLSLGVKLLPKLGQI